MPIVSNTVNTFSKHHFIFREKSIILQKDGSLPALSTMHLCIENSIASDWFTDTDYSYTGIMLEKNAPEPKGCIEKPLRQYFDEIKSDEQLLTKVTRAKGLFNFRATKRFCSYCGAELTDDERFTARTCTECGRQFFPQLEPAVITLVRKGNSVLLANHTNRDKTMWACLAGFVETGENLEHAVKREILEETGIKIKNLKYFGSQAWPFPDQLMLAFTADYDEGELKIQKDELKEARWFTKEDLTSNPYPPPGSIAHELIMDFINSR